MAWAVDAPWVGHLIAVPVEVQAKTGNVQFAYGGYANYVQAVGQRAFASAAQH